MYVLMELDPRGEEGKEQGYNRQFVPTLRG